MSRSAGIAIAFVLLGATLVRAAPPADDAALDVRQLVSIADGTPSDDVRREVIDELGTRGGLDTVVPLLNLAERNWEARRLSWAAVIRILERHDDAGSYSRVASMMPALGHEGRARLLSCVADAGSEHGRRLLAGTLGSDPTLDPVVISGLERMPGAADDAEAVSALRGLLRSERPDLRRDAARALGRIGDVDSLRTLAELLGGDDAVVKKEAHWALKQISGLEFPPDAARWKLWVDEELRFWDEKGEECLARLHSRDPAEIIRGISDLASHTLHRELVRQELEALLDHESPQVRNAARAALSPKKPAFLGGAGGGGGGGAMAVYRGEEAPAARWAGTRPRQSARRDPEEGGSSILLLLAGCLIVLVLLLRVSGHLSPDAIRRIFTRS